MANGTILLVVFAKVGAFDKTAVCRPESDDDMIGRSRSYSPAVYCFQPHFPVAGAS